MIVFFDEMDALFRTRGSGVSSDVEATIVPQLLSEIDGVEGLANVIVIGATNREDLIDPAILRPGRLDVKIKLDRPDQAGAAEILARYLTDDDAAEQRRRADPRTSRPQLVEAIVGRLYARTPENEFIEVTYASGAKEVLHVARLRLRRDAGRGGRPGQEGCDQGAHRRRAARRAAASTCWQPARRRSARTRNCPTPPTPTTGRGSPGARGSGSSSCAPCSGRAPDVTTPRP